MKEKFAWQGTIVEGKQKEYIKRHNNIWPQMKKVLKEAGICNYSIWMIGNKVFGYYECLKGVAYASRIQNESPVVSKWNDYMKDILIFEKHSKKTAQPNLKQVFELK